MELMKLDDSNRQVRVKSIEGRAGTCLIGKDGSQYSGALLTRVFKDITSIDNAQFIQQKQGEVTLNVVVNGGFSQDDMKRLHEEVFAQLGEQNFNIRINQISPQELVYSKRGKFNYIINLINVKRGGNQEDSRQN